MMDREECAAMSESDAGRTCAVVKAESSYVGKQGLSYFHGVSKESVGSTAICMHVLTIPPGGRANAHLHEAHESVVYVLSGESEMWYGHELEHYVQADAGDMLYIPAGVPHVPGNRSATEPVTAVIARTDPNEQESVVLRPDLEQLLPPKRA